MRRFIIFGVVPLLWLGAACGGSFKEKPSKPKTAPYQRDENCHEPIKDRNGSFFWVGCRPGYGPKNGIKCGLAEQSTAATNSTAWAWRCEKVVRHTGEIDD